jgi:hypothetical protein
MNSTQALEEQNLLLIPQLVQTFICSFMIYGGHQSRASFFVMDATWELVPISQACCETILIATGAVGIPIWLAQAVSVKASNLSWMVPHSSTVVHPWVQLIGSLTSPPLLATGASPVV